MRRKTIAVIIAFLSFGIGTASASNAPTNLPKLLFQDRKYFDKDGIYKVCDGTTAIYIYQGFGGFTGNSYQVSMTALANGCSR